MATATLLHHSWRGAGSRLKTALKVCSSSQGVSTSARRPGCHGGACLTMARLPEAMKGMLCRVLCCQCTAGPDCALLAGHLLGYWGYGVGAVPALCGCRGVLGCRDDAGVSAGAVLGGSDLALVAGHLLGLFTRLRQQASRHVSLQLLVRDLIEHRVARQPLPLQTHANILIHPRCWRGFRQYRCTVLGARKWQVGGADFPHPRTRLSKVSGLSAVP
jgi:hypothetical protein